MIMADKLNRSYSPFSQVNKSSAAQQFSFSKGTRFPRLKSPVCKNEYYVRSSFEQKDSQGVGFGIGTRFNPIKCKLPFFATRNFPKDLLLHILNSL